MGDVYRAEDQRLRRTVALKVVRPASDPEETSRQLLAEARAGSALTHPNIAVVYEVDEVAHHGAMLSFIAMEFVAGRTLADLAAQGPLALDTILDSYTPLLTRLPAGLAYVRPAVLAYRDGADEFGERWARQAFTAGGRELARDHWGLSLLAWHQASPRRRARMRQARDTLRAGFYRSADLAARLASTGSTVWTTNPLRGHA